VQRTTKSNASVFPSDITGKNPAAINNHNSAIAINYDRVHNKIK
jgi:hypothetical protein